MHIDACLYICRLSHGSHAADFKVLYKPLYDCGSKDGSFEAHHLAVSTFERWEQKFEPVPSGLSGLPPDAAAFVVPSAALSALSAGRTVGVAETSALPAGLTGGRGCVTVESASSALNSTASGYGTRSYTKYHMLDFAPEFQEMIISGKKTATTRIVKRSVAGSEPQLDEVARDYFSRGTGCVEVRATTTTPATADISKTVTIFAYLKIVGIEYKKVSDLSLELAKMEQFDSVDEFKQCLLRFYPSMTEEDEVVVFHFKYI
jgi:hypothetical protein